MTLQQKIEAAVAQLRSSPWDDWWTVERANQLIADYHGPDGAEGARRAWFEARFAERLKTISVRELAEWLCLATRHDHSRERKNWR